MNKDIFKKGGVILAPPQKSDAIYEIVFGAETPQEAFNWKQFLPVAEWQKSTTGCVSFSRLNCAETMAKKEGLDLNLSDRHLFALSGTTKNGNNLNSVSEAFRTLGVVREEYFPWKPEYLENQSVYWQEIFDVSSIPSEARRFLGGNHCWVNGKSAIRSALAYSPLQIAFPVYETYLFHTNDIIKKGKEVLVYHAVELYWIDLEGNYYIYDSAGDRNPFKVLDKDYPIMQAKSFRDLPLQWADIQPIKNISLQISIINKIVALLQKIISLLQQREEIKIITPPPPVELIDPDIIEPKEELKWGTSIEARHSCRVVMDEFNLAWKEKDLLCAVIQAESTTQKMPGGFDISAKHENWKNGKLLSTDFGICQINDGYWIGEGKYFLSTDEVLNFPEKSVRFLVEQYQRGHLTYWVSFKNGTYKQYL